MKAYKAEYVDGEWCTLVHGETAGDAKRRFWEIDPSDHEGSFIEVRVTRVPKLDDKPFTYKNALEAGFEYIDDEYDVIGPDEFVNDCNCPICRKE